MAARPILRAASMSSLGDPGKAMEFLKSTVKAVSRLALSEPQLIADLKDC